MSRGIQCQPYSFTWGRRGICPLHNVLYNKFVPYKRDILGNNVRCRPVRFYGVLYISVCYYKLCIDINNNVSTQQDERPLYIMKTTKSFNFTNSTFRLMACGEEIRTLPDFISVFSLLDIGQAVFHVEIGSMPGANLIQFI